MLGIIFPVKINFKQVFVGVKRQMKKTFNIKALKNSNLDTFVFSGAVHQITFFPHKTLQIGEHLIGTCFGMDTSHIMWLDNLSRHGIRVFATVFQV